MPEPEPCSFLDRYETWACGCTSAPRIYHRVVAYTLMASVVKRRVWFDFAGDRLFPNVWVCLLGDSGILHKSTAINLGVRLLQGFDVLYPSDFSLQRLYDVMASKPQGTLIYREFRSLVDMLGRDYMAGAKSVLTDLYDCPPYVEYDTRTNKLVRVPDPSLTVLAASTAAWLTGKETLRDLSSGFLARFAFVPAWPDECEREDPLPPGKESTTAGRDALAAELTSIGYAQGRMRLHPLAEQQYRDWHAYHRAMSPFRSGPLSAFLVRSEVLCLKLAMLEHLAQGRDTADSILPTSVIAARELVDDLERRMMRCFGEDLALTPYQVRRQQALKLIPNGTERIGQRELLRLLRWPVRHLEDVLAGLIQEGEVLQTFEKSPGAVRPKAYLSRLSSQSVHEVSRDTDS